MVNMKLPILTTICIASALGLSACGDSSAPSSTSGTNTTTKSASSNEVRKVSITGNDQLQYNLKEIKAKAGEKLQIELKNIGKMPKQTMAHNWVLLKQMDDSEVNAFGMAAATKPPEYLPDDTSAVLYHTRMLGPNESDIITITVPKEVGKYPFLCTFPGHSVMMKGHLIVE